MKGLLIKDFEWIVCQKNTMFLFLVLSVFYLVMGMGEFAVIFLSVLLSILFSKSILFDESNNGMLYLFSMPCTKEEYVMEKYLFSILTSVLTAAVLCIIMTLFLGVNTYDSLMMLAVSAGEICLLTSFNIPVILKFGQNGQVILSLIIFAPFILLVVFKEEISSLDLSWLENAAANIQASWALGLGALILLITALSIWISIRILNKREY